MAVVEVERLIVVVDFRQVRVGKDLRQHPPFGAHLGLELAVGFTHPTAIPLLLVFPFLWIADAGLSLDVVEPGVFNALTIGPHVLAGHRTGVATDAFV